MENLAFYLETHTKISCLPILIRFFLFRPRPPLPCQQARPYPRLSSTSNLHSSLHHGLQVHRYQYLYSVLKWRAIRAKVLPFTWKRIFDQPSTIAFRNFTHGKFCQAKPQLSSEPDAPLLQVTLIPKTCENVFFHHFSLKTLISSDLDCGLIDPLAITLLLIITS